MSQCRLSPDAALVSIWTSRMFTVQFNVLMLPHMVTILLGPLSVSTQIGVYYLYRNVLLKAYIPLLLIMTRVQV